MNLLRAKLAVITMLVVQVLVLLIGLDAYYEVTIFCTGPTTSPYSWIFGSLHFAFLGLLGLGIASLRWRNSRPIYLILILVSLAALPMQMKLVHAQVLQCDLP